MSVQTRFAPNDNAKLAGKLKVDAAKDGKGGLKRAALGDISNAGKAKIAVKQHSTTTFAKPAVAVGPSKLPPAAVPKLVSVRQQPQHADSLNLDSLHDDLMAIDQSSHRAVTRAAAAQAVHQQRAESTFDDGDWQDEDAAPAKKSGSLGAHASGAFDLDDGSDDQAATLISGGVGVALQAQALVAAAVQHSAVPADVEDIDLCDEDDAQCVVEYVNEILAYMRFQERDVQQIADPNYLRRQSDLTPRMRAILVDWMVDVQMKFKLLSETMFLAVNIIDRFLSRVEVNRTKLQLVGVTAMLIASKYEEIYSPEVRDFEFISDHAFTKDEILALEIKILNVLRFSLTPATPLAFLRRFSKAARSEAPVHTLAKYLIELALPEYSMLQYPASTVAASAVYISRAMHNTPPCWNPTLVHYTQLDVPDFRACAHDLNKALLTCWLPTATLKATKRKYCQAKFLEVGRIQPLELLPFEFE